ncbi:testicular haploid expressed gene protein-like [Actinia tenebrosa]|uniref:Testicular haploid expressed gene protein-like n=1 Tax=Actinia tenebrosa TaxID=6105 RepID=A0A6P8I9E3_ACTTE|nr:testicular haploid expressed gene protein-like [Actinia tenebrosa]
MPSRLKCLAKPKKNFAAWVTRHSSMDWSNQTLMRPISKAALHANPTPRLEQLATPKKNFQLENPECCHREQFVYSCGRASVIWKTPPLRQKQK